MKRNMRAVSLGMTAALALTAFGGTAAFGQDEAGECVATTADENLAIVEAYVTAADSNDAELLEQQLHDSFTDNQFRYGLETDETTNADEIALLQAMHELYPQHQNVIDELYAFDDKVLLVATMVVDEHTLTEDGGVAMLDASAEMPIMGLYTIECGQIIAGHTVTDIAALFGGLGVPVPPQM